MRKVLEALRLRLDQGRSLREIAAILALSQSTAHEYLRRFRVARLAWPLPDPLDEAALDAALFARAPLSATASRPVPDWAAVHQELKRKAVTPSRVRPMTPARIPGHDKEPPPMKRMLAPAAESSPASDTLETFARTHVQGFIQQVLEDEVTALLGRAKSARRADVDAPRGSRDGHGKPRQLALMSGTVTLRRPRVRDLKERFVSRLLPLFQRRTTAVTTLLPDLDLHGLALGDLELALRGLLGAAAPLSASSLVGLKATWQAQYTAWHQHDLSACRLVYHWADGVYVKAGLDTSKAALLVLIGADADGQKLALAVTSGQRESTESWATVLRDLKRRGLRAPKRTIADGHLGIWSGLAAVYPESAEQRCWNHKLRNVLDTVPKKHQPEVKAAVQAIASVDTLREATRLRDAFARTYRRAHPKTVERLTAEWDRMVAYYAFPQEHGPHIRTTKVIESPCAAVRLRTSAAKRFTRVENATALIWKTLLVVAHHFRTLNAPHLGASPHDGAVYRDGLGFIRTPARKLRAA